MANNLVIVESPAKAKTIKKFLGSGYEVVASGGHVRDLPKSTLGVDVKEDYEPHYITIRGKGDVLANLRKEVKKAKKVYLATDPDREGEAISWHLKQVLKLDDKNTHRITFNEITKSAVKNSIGNARDIDMNLVDAQQTRRILDRMVGYEISPILWNKVKRGLSAGRVQSVTLRIVCDREAEIAAFRQEEYWSISGEFFEQGYKKPIVGSYYGTAEGKAELRSYEDAQRVLRETENAEFRVTSVRKGERRKKAPLPFTTSTLQQDASKSLNFTTQKTMRVAQQLYEGVDIRRHGTIGLITYLRTDSTRVSDEADASAKAYIQALYGDSYVAAGDGLRKEKKNIQDAHEAIRPTYIELTPAQIKDQLTNEQFRLYQLIWKRFIASRMTDAIYDTASIDIEGNGHVFRAASSCVAFDGYLSVYSETEEKGNGDENDAKAFKNRIPAEGASFSKVSFADEQHFTQPPAHYTEASLVKTMEELGIGRPSTYAPTITTLLARHYIAKEGKKLFVTELGEAVNSIMKEAFTSIVEVDFTANMELLLDGVEDGSVNWKMVVRNFYPDLKQAVDSAADSLDSVKIEDEVTEVICDVCGRNMVVKYGPHGKFLACPGFPECRNTKQLLERTGISCPECGKELVIRRTKKGRRYYGCEGYPECNFMSWQKPTTKDEK